MDNVILMTTDKLKSLVQFFTNPLQSWARRNSLYPLFLGQACCAIEMASTMGARWDTERIGVLARASPRHCDMMWINGSITHKFAPRLRELYDLMPAPKYVFATGQCAISGGPFFEGYSIVEGTDQVIPVDVSVPGCPPRPEAMFHGLRVLQKKIQRDKRFIREHKMPKMEEFWPRTDPLQQFRIYSVEKVKNELKKAGEEES